MSNVHPSILEQVKLIPKGKKRAKALAELLIEKGKVSTKEIREMLNEEHPPSAARDLKDLGIPIKMTWGSSNGRRYGIYEFDNPDLLENNILRGRQYFPKSLKSNLIKRDGERCNISNINFKSQYLQIDHRIPYRLAGENGLPKDHPEDFQLLSAASQKQKSKICEGECQNFKSVKNPEICKDCYWAYPEDYNHIATQQIRVLNVGFLDKDVELFERIKSASLQSGLSMDQLIIDLIKQNFTASD